MSVRGQAALAIWMDVLPESEEDFHRWYREQHFPERLGVPGFLRGRRYAATRGAPRYFTLYETEGPEVLVSPAYLARLNHPTEWTRRVLSTMRNVVRNAYRLVARAGDADGEALLALRAAPAPGGEEALRRWYAAEVAGLVAVPGVLAAALLEAEQVATGVVTEERKLIGSVGAAPRFLCLVELRGPEGADDPGLRGRLGLDASPGAPGAQAVTENVYRLVAVAARD